jgi:uncharacterized Zn-finger protein
MGTICLNLTTSSRTRGWLPDTQREASPNGPGSRTPMRRSNEDIMFIEINPAPGQERQTVQTLCQSQRPQSLSGSAYFKFRNDRGVREICIGVREFKCIGESPPQDHPHVYINMGTASAILCPYCGTQFRFDPSIDTAGCSPAGQFGQN